MKLYLLGGRPCSGKTTFAYHLGEKFGMKVWYLDVFAYEHIEASTVETPSIYRWKGKDLIDMLQKEPQILFNEYIELYEALFPLLLKELDTVEDEKIILEGSILIPKFIEKLKEKHDVEICYMITDDNFVNKKYIKRDYVQEMLTKLNGEVALKNLLARDQIFAKYILDELEKHPFTQIHVEDDNDFEGYFIKLQEIFKL